MNGDYRALGFAIAEQAVEDLKELRRLGVIQGGKVTPYWPTTTNKKGKKQRVRYLGYYNSPNSVKQLLHFFTGDGLQRLLTVLQSDLDVPRIRTTLQIGLK